MSLRPATNIDREFREPRILGSRMADGSSTMRDCDLNINPPQDKARKMTFLLTTTKLLSLLPLLSFASVVRDKGFAILAARDSFDSTVALLKQTNADISNRRLQNATDTMVNYAVAWAFIDNGCQGFVPILDIECGGSLRFHTLEDYQGTNAQCSQISNSKVTCTSEYDSTIDGDPILSVGIIFDCVGATDADLQAVAHSHGQTSVTCNGGVGLASHIVDLAYLLPNVDDLLFDRTCELGSADPDGSCAELDSCSGEGCALTSLGDVRAKQIIPIIAEAKLADTSAAADSALNVISVISFAAVCATIVGYFV